MISRYGALVDIDDSEMRLMLECGQFLLETQQHDRAIRVYEGLVAMVPDKLSPRFGLGHTYTASGHRQKAKRVFEQALSVNEEDFLLKTYLAETYLVLGVKETEAFDMLEAAAASDDAEAHAYARALLDAQDVGVFERIRSGDGA